MRPVLAIDHSEIEILAACADQIQCIARALSEVTEASAFQKDLSHAFFKAGIVRQESYDRCVHAPSVHEHANGRSAAIAI